MLRNASCPRQRNRRDSLWLERDDGVRSEDSDSRSPGLFDNPDQFEMFGLVPVPSNFNDLSAIVRTLQENPDIRGALVQHSRQKIDDSYHLAEVIATIKQTADIPVLIDDNYGVMKVERSDANAERTSPASRRSSCRDRKGSAVS